MKKRFLLSLIVLLFSQGLFSQIAITDADMPNVNDIITYSNTLDAQGQDPVLTGPNYTWDYSALTYTTQSSDTFVTVSSTPVAYQFYFNNGILYPTWKASYALTGIDIGIPQVPITDVYNYYKKSSSFYSHVGFGAKISGVPSSTRNIPVDEEYAFPLNYGNTHQSNSEFEVSVPTFGVYGQALERIDTVDGWGQLTTPYGTFDCLRVKSILNKTDTTYIDALGFGTTISRPEEIEYKWLANGMGTPVLKIVTNLGNITSIQYQDSLNTVGLEGIDQLTSINVFPNPTQSYVSINFTAKSSENVPFIIKDNLGKMVVQEKFNVVSGKNMVLLNLLKYNIKSGIYFLQFAIGEKTYNQKIVFNQ